MTAAPRILICGALPGDHLAGVALAEHAAARPPSPGDAFDALADAARAALADHAAGGLTAVQVGAFCAHVAAAWEVLDAVG